MSNFELQAMVTVLESAAEKAADKQARRKRGGKELQAFTDVLIPAVKKDIPLGAAVKAALKVALNQSSDSLSWLVQGIAGDLFWTYRRMAVSRRRADNQAQAMATDSDQSTAEILAMLAESGDYEWDAVSDANGEEVEDVTLEEIEFALFELHSALNDVYIMCADSMYDILPYTSRGSQVGTTIDSALALADMIIEDGNKDRRIADRSILS